MGLHNWVGLALGRLSFGLIGRLNSVRFTPIHVVMEIHDLVFSDDILDTAKLGLSGTRSIAELIPALGDTRWLYLLAVTNQGQLRTTYCASVTVVRGEPMAMYTSPYLNTISTWQYTPVLSSLELSSSVDVDRWETFFMGEDTQWEQSEACLAKNLTGWKTTNSILTQMLCPPISSC